MRESYRENGRERERERKRVLVVSVGRLLLDVCSENDRKTSWNSRGRQILNLEVNEMLVGLIFSFFLLLHFLFTPGEFGLRYQNGKHA